MRKALITILFLVGVALSACSVEAPAPTAVPSATLYGTLRPYPSATSTVTPLPTDYLSPTPSPTVTLTSTPVYYEVGENDDMYSIGWRFNVSPAQIMTANPTINPRAMGIGTTLLIPVTPDPDPTEAPIEEMTAAITPAFSSVRQPDCYPDALGGLWCFALAENQQGEPVENLSGRIILISEDEPQDEIAITPLNLLPMGEFLPLVAYFHPPLPSDYTVSAEADFFLPVMPGDGRYLPVVIKDQSLHLSENGLLAVVTGQLSLPVSQPRTRYLWLNATAFDKEGHVVALRRWDSPDQLSGGEQVPFELYLYSLGAIIDRVELLAEAQPPLQPSKED